MEENDVFQSARYVLHENVANIYRTISIAKYELLADMRDSKLGIFWNFANPAINVFTYWFLFGYVLHRKSVDEIPYIVWMLGGMVVWFFVSPCITEGCNAIYSKVDVITKMKFPISILPLTVVLKRLFNHFIFFCIFTDIIYFKYACQRYKETDHILYETVIILHTNSLGCEYASKVDAEYRYM